MVLMEALVHQRKVLLLSQANINVSLSLHYNANNSYLFVNGKVIFQFKAANKNLTFQVNFVSEVYLMDLVLVTLEKYF